MVYAIEYFKQNDETMTFYKLPVTFTVIREEYVAIKKFEHIAKCLRNTKGIRTIKVETIEALLDAVDYPDYSKGSNIVMKMYYECRVRGYEGGIYKVQLTLYENNPYF